MSYLRQLHCGVGCNSFCRVVLRQTHCVGCFSWRCDAVSHQSWNIWQLSVFCIRGVNYVINTRLALWFSSSSHNCCFIFLLLLLFFYNQIFWEVVFYCKFCLHEMDLCLWNLLLFGVSWKLAPQYLRTWHFAGKSRFTHCLKRIESEHLSKQI